VAAGPIFIAFKFRAWLVSRAPQVSFRSAFAWMIVLALPLIVVSVVPLAYSIAVEAQGLANSMEREKPEQTEEKTSLRFELWGQAIQRGVGSGMLGLGPGPHLEIPHSIVSQRNLETEQPDFVEHPTLNFAPNFEAHNTFLDLFTQGGLIILLSYIWIVATAFWFAYRTGQAGLPTLLCGLCIYSIATFILRHPIFWFVIALCLVAEPGRTDRVRSATGGKALSGILPRSPLRIGYATSKLGIRSS
jgi:O-antigen ligase